MPAEPALSVVIPTLGRPRRLRQALAHLDRQQGAPPFEVVIGIDSAEKESDRIERLAHLQQVETRTVNATRPGASAARNAAWRAARAPVVLFLDDDVLAEPDLIASHAAAHARAADSHTAVLGHVRWARRLAWRPFLRWIADGIQFDYGTIPGRDARWWHLYTANVSIPRALLEAVDGFDEERLPFGYEDLDLGLRLDQHGMRLRYEPEARARHLHPQGMRQWRRRVVRIARAEHAFHQLHPGFPTYFHDLFQQAAARPPARGRGVWLAVLPRRTPLLGARVWASYDLRRRQELAPIFLAAWKEAEEN